MAKASLPPGFRFHPTDVELIMYYLKRKVMGMKLHFEAISELNIYKYSPWDLPDKCCLRSKDLEWYFFCPRAKKYGSGARANRSTEKGYWKATGKDRAISYKDRGVGMIRTLVFYIGHAPRGDRTDWVMHEYRLESKDLADAGIIQDSYVLCKVFQKSGPGPKNGAQYGAPFDEEEWNDDTETFINFLPTNGLFQNALALSRKHDESAASGMIVPGTSCQQNLSESGPSASVLSVSEVLPSFPDDDDIASWLDMFTENVPLLPFNDDNNQVYDNNQNLDGSNHAQNIVPVPHSDVNDIFNGLADVGGWGDLSEVVGLNNFSTQKFGCTSNNTILLGGNVDFLELNDLLSPLACSAKTTGQGQLPTDSLCSHYNDSANLEQLSYRSTYPGAVENVPGLIQPPLPAEGFDTGAHFNLNQMDNGAANALNQGFSTNSSTKNFAWGDTAQNMDFLPCLDATGQNLERGGFHYFQS